jgi:serine/threonine-protein kinase
MPVPGATFSHYKILEEIGSGGMGVVYKAQDVNLDRVVALKFLPPHLVKNEEARKRFVHEARAASALDHPNVGTVYEIDETSDGHLYISMGYYDGLNLKQRIAEGPLDVDEVVDLAIQIASGLAEAHKRDILHRDIKPSNVIVTGGGRAKIVDFGLAKLADATKITKTGESTGTPAYMSPEQVRCENLDSRTDLFSFGMVLYEMLTGRHPFRGDNQAAIAHSILNDHPELPSTINPEVTPALDEVVSRALEKRVDSRYQGADEMLADLEVIRDALAAGGQARLGIRKSNIWRSVAIAALSVAAVVVLVIYFARLRVDKTGMIDPEFLVVLPTPGPFKILLAPFWAADDEAAKEGLMMQSLLAREIEDLIEGDRFVALLALDSGMAPRLESDAMALGREVDASLVIWGSIIDLEGERELHPRLTMVRPLGGMEDQYESEYSALSSEMGTMRLRAEDAGEVADFALIAAARHYRSANPEKALSIVSQLPEDSPDRYMLQGAILIELERRDEAISSYERASELAPGMPGPYIEKGWALYFGDADYSLCETAFKKAVDVAPADPSSHLNLASFYVHMGKPEAAAARLEKCLELAGDDAGVYSQIASAYHMAAYYDEAIEALETTLTLAPGDVGARCNLANVYSDMGMYDKAEDELLQATRLAPEEAHPWVSLGWLRIDEGEFMEAVRFFEEAASRDPRDMTIYLGMGRAYAELGMRDDTVRSFRKAVDAQKASSAGFFTEDMMHIAMGVNYRDVRWYEEALGEFRAAHEMDPDDFVAIYYMGIVLEDLGEFGDALEAYRTALNNAESMWWYWPQVRCYLALIRLGQHDEARALLAEYTPGASQDVEIDQSSLIPVMQLYAGEMGEAAYMEAMLSNKNPYSRAEECEATYYLGMANLLAVPEYTTSADTARAIELLKGCLATGSDDQIEYYSAISELARLRPGR